MTAFATNWSVQQSQLRAKSIELDLKKRERLFSQFIDEASRLFGDAMTHDNNDITSVIKLYALIANLRLVSSTPVIAAAEQVMDRIIQAYLEPNRTLRELAEIDNKREIDVLLRFSEVCRTELMSYTISKIKG